MSRPPSAIAIFVCILGCIGVARAGADDGAADEVIAILDFDGYGVTWTDTQSAADGLRAALLSSGKLQPLTGAEISRRMLGEGQAELNQARRLVAEARQRVAADEQEEALSLFAEALAIHDALGSGVCRRPEVADIFGWSAIAMAKMGWDDEALAYMVEALALYPRWHEDRTSELTPALRGAFEAATGVLDGAPRRVEPATGLDATIATLGTPRLVLGRLERDGSVVLQVFEGTVHRGALAAQAASLPLTQSDPVFRDLARRLERTFPVAPMVVDAAPGVAQPTAPTPVPTEPEILARTRWWLWPVVLGTTAGGGALIGATLVSPPPTYEVIPPSWVVTVDGSE
jgi:hypothetical protein